MLTFAIWRITMISDTNIIGEYKSVGIEPPLVTGRLGGGESIAKPT